MKQVFYGKSGTVCKDVPPPPLTNSSILVETKFSCISAGTEMAAVKNASKSLVKRVMEDPKKLLPMAKNLLLSRGLKAAMKVATGATGGGLGNPLGYTAAGTVLEAGQRSGFEKGQRVAVVGAGFANHAQINSVPRNMAAIIPEGVSYEEASTAAVGCIAMQGVRRLEPLAGETIVVMGLGILGLITVQLLKSMGCRVIGIDLNEKRLQLAESLGCDMTVQGTNPSLVDTVAVATGRKGADGVVFTAATSSSTPMSNCFKMLRRKGRFVLVGVSGMEIERGDIYAKELDFRIATSYGAGRYDADFESLGMDYPREWVRFTQQRNIEEYLRLIALGKVRIKDLITDIFDAQDVGEAYQALKDPDKSIIALLKYPPVDASSLNKTVFLSGKNAEKPRESALRFAIIGAGSFVRSMHMPNISQMPDKFSLHAVMSRSGASAAQLGTLYGASYVTVDESKVLADDQVDMAIISTRHDSHADYSIKVLNAGKSVFVEKPAAVNQKQLDALKVAAEESKAQYMVGFNRRFSEYANQIRDAFAARKGPMHLVYTMNAGYLPKDHWTHSAQGGGRIVGEGCHIVDLVSSLVGSQPQNMYLNALRDDSGQYSFHDNVSVTLIYEDASVATILYLACGSSQFQKETLRVHCDGEYVIMNDYTGMESSIPALRKLKNSAPNKGHVQELTALYEAISSGRPAIPLQQIWDTTQITLDIRNMAPRAAGLTAFAGDQKAQ